MTKTKRPIYKFFTALLTAAMLVALLPTTASAALGYNMSDRSENLNITSGEYSYVIDGSSTYYAIIVNAPGQTINITLEGVNIQMSPAYSNVAFKIEAGTVNLTLVGDSILKSGNNHAGIENGENVLNISGSGTLTAQGGSWSAGIGGGDGGNGSNITINGGTIIAKGGNDAAGIGSGNNGNANNIVINGGTVTAIGGYKYAAGIGSNNGTASNIIINGGSVKVSGGVWAKNAIGSNSAAVTPKNSSGADLMLTTKTFLFDTEKSYLAGLSYNLAGANAIDKTYYLYLPKYAITYHNTDGATHSNPSEYNVLSGITLFDADKSAYVFNGWFDSETGGNKVTAIPQGITGDKDLYATWSAMPVLESIQPPTAISDIKNGTEKTVAALGLPSMVTLATDSGNVQANVTWIVNFCPYDPSSASAQTFMVIGTVTLPDGILNTHNIGLTAGITVSVNAAPTYSIGLSQSSTYSFPAQTPEYSPVSPLSVMVSNAGNQATGALSVALSGMGKDSFTLSKTNIGSIATSGSDNFTVSPNDSLTAGIYTATVTVSGGNSISKSFDVNFTVNETPTYGIGLSQSGAYTFAAQTAGYSPVSPLSVTVSNTGNQITGGLTVALSGTGKDNFTLSKTNIGSIATGGSDNFMVSPNDSLTAGIYTATVTVSGGNSISQSFDINFTVGEASTYGIGLSQSGTHTFTAQTVGYSPVSPLSVTVSNTGNQATGALTAVLSGTGKNSFTLSKTNIGSIAKSGKDSFTVQPNDSLTAGIYTATVTVSGGNSISKSFDISFTVNKASTGGGSGSGGSSGGGSTSTTGNNSSITVTTNNNTTTAAQSFAAVTGSNGVASASMTRDQITNMMKAASEKAKEQHTQPALEIKVNPSSAATGLSVTIPQGADSSLTDGVNALTISSPVVSVTFDDKALAEIGKNTIGDITVMARKPDNTALSDEDKAIIGSRPVYDLKITSGGTAISGFGGGSATVRIPYTPAAGEDTNKIVVYYISDSGKLIMVPDCVYDASTGMVTFKTTHFSSYAIAYNDVSFTDVSGWYAGYANYLAARGIINRTGDGKFRPNANITRAEFVTILANLSGNDLSCYTASSFTDVSANDWYFAAVQWANKNGIASGYNGKFDPNANITRQDISVIMARYAEKVEDYSLPETNSVMTFTDSAEIATYASGAVTAMQRAGIISGNNDGSFAPTGNATRAQVVKIIALLLKGMIEN